VPSVFKKMSPVSEAICTSARFTFTFPLGSPPSVKFKSPN